MLVLCMAVVKLVLKRSLLLLKLLLLYQMRSNLQSLGNQVCSA
jgi:hypothetical protein